MNEFYVWYTACAIVKGVSQEEVESGNFEFVRKCNEDQPIEDRIIENFDICEEILE